MRLRTRVTRGAGSRLARLNGYSGHPASPGFDAGLRWVLGNDVYSALTYQARFLPRPGDRISSYPS